MDTPTIDGTPIDQIIRVSDGLDDPGRAGCYERAEAVSTREYARRRKFTAFVKFGKSVAEVEEIDVVASDQSDARVITELALMWHYQDGGEIVGISEWPQGVTLHHWL